MMPPLVIRNNMAIVGWVFTVFWVGGLVIFTGLFATEGGFGQFDPFVESGIMLAFWIGALVLIAQLMTKPRVVVVVQKRFARLKLAWLVRRQEVTLSAEDMTGLTLKKERDSDGDPYFELALIIPSGHRVVLCESQDRTRVETLHRDILVRMGA